MRQTAMRILQQLRGIARRTGFRDAMPTTLRRWMADRLLRLTIEMQVTSRVDPQTILLADFPRCGMGWIRFLLATVLHYQNTGAFRKLTFDDMYPYAPTLTGREATYQPYRFHGGSHLLKTHAPYHPQFRRAIVIYRNPYEAIRSNYTLDITEEAGSPYGRLRGHSEEETYLVEMAREYITFHESWLSAIRACPSAFLVVKYEDMVTHPLDILRQILSFLALDAALPPNGLEQLASLYTRTDVSPPFRNRLPLEEGLRRKAASFQRLQPIMQPAVLGGIAPELERALMASVEAMDHVRCRVEEAAVAPQTA